MIKIYNNIFTDDRTRKDYDAILAALKEHRFKFGVYCIMFPVNVNNLLDIVNANELKFHYYRSRTNYIIGLAHDKESAVEIVTDIILKAYEATGTFNLKEYYDKNNFEIL